MTRALSPNRPADQTGPRIAFFDAYPHVDAGGQRVLHLQADVARERGALVRCFLPAPGRFAERLRADGLEPTIVATPGALRHYGRTTVRGRAVLAALALPGYWARLAQAFRAWKPDLVHVNDHRGLLLAGVPARIARARVVWHIHALQPGSRLTAMGVTLADAILVPSRAVVDAMPELERRGTVTVLANTAPDWGPPTPPPADPSLVTIARLHPDKGIDVLLQAVASLRPSIAGLRLTVIGGPQHGWDAYADDLRRLAADLGLADTVHFAGETSDVEPLLRSHAVYVQPSRERTEILPLSVLEAMAAARPIVASDVGALRELVVPGETGVLVPQQRPDVLADALRTLLGDPERLAAMGAAGHARAQNHFGRARFAASLAEVYGALGAPIASASST